MHAHRYHVQFQDPFFLVRVSWTFHIRYTTRRSMMDQTGDETRNPKCRYAVKNCVAPAAKSVFCRALNRMLPAECEEGSGYRSLKASSQQQRGASSMRVQRPKWESVCTPPGRCNNTAGSIAPRSDTCAGQFSGHDGIGGVRATACKAERAYRQKNLRRRASTMRL